MYPRKGRYKTSVEYFKPQIKETFASIEKNSPIITPIPDKKPPVTINADVYTKDCENTSDPNIWGPCFWFTLHNGALRYPKNPTMIYKERMKGYIRGIPYMVPCETCKHHALAMIENSDLDDVTSDREKLFKFFVMFHNVVNKRYGKPEISVDDAYKKYSGGVKLTYIKY